MKENYILNFFTVAFGRYKLFVVPYIAAALYNNPNAIAEVLVDDISFLTRPQRNFLNKYYKNRWSIRTFPERLQKWKNGKWKKSIRWLSIPETKTKYVYTGDIDIVILDKNIHEAHIKHSLKIQKPYSNIVRKNGINMTGLHFIVSDPYYKKINNKYIENIMSMIERSQLRPKSLDERLLCRMMKENFGLPDPKKQYRPGHGIHFSLRRPILKWGGGRNRSRLNEMAERDFWKAGLRIFDSRFLKILSVYETFEKWRVYDQELGVKIQSGTLSKNVICKLRKKRTKLRQIYIKL